MGLSDRRKILSVGFGPDDLHFEQAGKINGSPLCSTQSLTALVQLVILS